MYKSRFVASAVIAAVAALVHPLVAGAATNDELKALREQVRLLKENYEQRIEALERRLQIAEQSTVKAAAVAGKAQATAGQAEATANQAALQASSRPSGEGAFNPGISLILNGTYGNVSRDPASYRIGGFAPTGGEVAPPNRGLSLGESELAFTANIDHYFRGTLITSLAPDNSIGVENATLQTTALSNGLSIKAGRFFSSVGYLNEIHAHAWDFVDAPLANKVFLGNQLADDGVQFKWVAPTDLYMDLGVEFGRGRAFPGGPDGGRSKNGIGSGNLFAHLGGDLGASTAWQVGLSHLRTSPQDRSYADPDSTGTGVTNGFTGRSRLWALSGVLKWAPNGNKTETNFKLQGEYFRRSEDGMLTYDTAAASRGTQTGSYASRQSGWYLQGVYQFMPMWRAGVRYDRLSAGTTSLGLVNTGALSAADFPILGSHNPSRNTFMLDWSPSEFSRLRLQIARDRSIAGVTDNQIFLQYIMSLGAHGAHTF